MKKHISYIILAGAILLSLSFSVSAQSIPTVTMDKPIKDMTISELQTKIAEILSVIQQLQALIAQLQTGGVGVSCNFYRNLYPGTSGSDVKCLQQYLNDAGHTLANSGPGSPSNETIYYGSLTRAAVKKWQDANNIEQGVWWGYFGPKSQAKYNELAAIQGEQEEPPTPPLSGTYCGDSIAQRPSDQGTIEDCDGTDIRNKTCITQGYTGGTLSCSNDCSFNTSLCTGTGPDIPTPPLPGPTTQCGDSIMQKPNSEGIYEVCDSTNLGTSTCLTYGYVGGTLSCSSNCITFNTSNCITASVGGGGGGAQTPVGPECGDSDGICPSGCTHSQDTDCTYCGDNVLQRPNDEGILEVCDNTKLNNQTCITKGFPSGTLQCSNTCLTFDTSSCTSPSPPNQAPVLSTIDNKSINENQQLSFTVSGTDTDGDVLSYSVQDRPSGATFSSQTFTWTPTYEQSGTYNVIFTVSDGTLTDTETITITVNNVNRDPVLNPIGDKAIQQNNALTFTISATDPDNDTLTYTASVPSGASFNSSTRIFTWTPSNTGTYNTTFTVSDGSLTDTETISITVTTEPQPNNPPTAENQSITLSEDNSISITLSATDLDGDILTYAIVSNPSQGTLSGTAPDIIYTPNTNYNGIDSFTFRANDTQVNSNTATISLTINPVNDAPVLNSIGNKSVDENQQLSFTVSGTDIDGDTLYYSIQDSPLGASFNSSTRTFSWTPTYEQQGTYTPTFIVSDTEYTDQETITIIVNNVVTGPVCGDTICEGIETCSTCSADCGACPATFPTDYISWWRFDETSGLTAYDSGPGGNDGTLVSGASFVPDADRGQVLSLDGAGDYVNCGNDASLNIGNFTISAWINPSGDLSGYEFIVSKRYSEYEFGLLNNQLYLEGQINGNRVRTDSGALTVSTGVWQHAVVVWNGINTTFYVNGVSIVGACDTACDETGSFDALTNNLYIGQRSPSGVEFNGLIDEVMIFDRSLSQSEIQQIMNIEVECVSINDCPLRECMSLVACDPGGTGYDYLDPMGCGYNYDDGASCDSLYCQIGQTCLSGACQGGSDRGCSDAVACTDDGCNEVSNTCENIANNSNCPGETCDPSDPGADPITGCVADPCAGITECSNYIDSGNCSANTCELNVVGGCVWNAGVCEEFCAGINVCSDYNVLGESQCNADTCVPGGCLWNSSSGVCEPTPLIENAYYVRPAGGSYESEDGSDYANAWDGLKKVVWGAGGVGPGDTLYVCGFHLFPYTAYSSSTTTVDVTASGTAESRIMIRGDCSGDPGIIWGGHIIGGGEVPPNWVNVGDNTYRTSSTTTTTHFYFEDVNATSYTLLTKVNSIQQCKDTPGSYYSPTFQYGGDLYVHTSDNGHPADRIVRPGKGWHLKINGRQYITFKDIDFYEQEPQLFGNHIRWEGCKLWYIGYGLRLYDGTHHIEFIDCDRAYGTGGFSFFDFPPRGVDAPHHMTIRGCKIHDIGIYRQNVDAEAIGNNGVDDFIVENNEFYNVGSAYTSYPYSGTTTKNIIIRWNYIHDLHRIGGARGTGIEVGIAPENEGDVSGNQIYGNIVTGSPNWAYSSNYDLHELVFYNNIAYNCRDSFYFNAVYGETGPKIKLRNLISINPTRYHLYLGSDTTAGNYRIDSDYNLFYPDKSQGFEFKESGYSTKTTFSGWQALSRSGCTFDPNSIVADPLFVSADPQVPADFKLLLGSPAIDAGVDVGLTQDYEGNPIPQGLGPDIGAYESGASPARISSIDEKINNLASVLSSIRSEVQDIMKKIQSLF